MGWLVIYKGGFALQLSFNGWICSWWGYSLLQGQSCRGEGQLRLWHPPQVRVHLGCWAVVGGAACRCCVAHRQKWWCCMPSLVCIAALLLNGRCTWNGWENMKTVWLTCVDGSWQRSIQRHSENIKILYSGRDQRVSTSSGLHQGIMSNSVQVGQFKGW